MRWQAKQACIHDSLPALRLAVPMTRLWCFSAQIRAQACGLDFNFSPSSLILRCFFSISPLRPHLHKNTVYYRVPNPFIPVLLLRDVSGLGTHGQFVQVRRGTLRNFLLPRGLAVVASWQNIDRYYLLSREEAEAKRLNSTEAAASASSPVSDASSYSLAVLPHMRVGSTKDRLLDESLCSMVESSCFFPSMLREYRAAALTRRQQESATGSCNGKFFTEAAKTENAPYSGLVENDATFVRIGTPPKRTSSARSRLSGEMSLQINTIKHFMTEFLVNTDASNSCLIRGKGVSLFDLLNRLSEDFELDVLPSQVRLASTNESLQEGQPGPPVAVNVVSSRFQNDICEQADLLSAGSKSDARAAALQQLRLEGIIRFCGVYVVRLVSQEKYGLPRSATFKVQISSKQDLERRLEERRKRGEVEAQLIEFSLGPDV